MIDRECGLMMVWRLSETFGRKLGAHATIESSRAKTNRSHKLVSKTVHNVLYYAFPLRRETLSNCVTDCVVLAIVTMQSAFEPQARNNVFWDSSFENRIKSLHASCI